ncbi:chromate transporter, partial [Streptomyces calidiresistens]|uniref:chromate transporter n=1 Tax=Streptomyces calidiresistens TaxID=1485586 RepID=UPI002B1EE84C
MRDDERREADGSLPRAEGTCGSGPEGPARPPEGNPGASSAGPPADGPAPGRAAGGPAGRNAPVAGSQPPPRLATIAREWGRIGLLGFGGPPAHIAMLRETCVERRRWVDPERFEDGIATTNLLPGPASTQLAILTAWWLRGARGALVGGFCFIVPGLILIIALAALFLAGNPPVPVRGAAAGAGAAVAAVAAHAAWQLMPDSRRRAVGRAARARWYGYLA